MDPNVILGGFNSESQKCARTEEFKYPCSIPSLELPNGTPNYNNATALIVSIPVLNHKDDKDNLKAKIWEKGFLEYLKNYKGEFIEISYSAEVSYFVYLAVEYKCV